MRLTRGRRARRESGQALPMVIGMMMVFGIAVATVMTLRLSSQPSTDTVGFLLSNGANVHAATYAVNDVQISNNATQWGPVIGRSVSISNNASQAVPIVKLPPRAPDIASIVKLVSGTWCS